MRARRPGWWIPWAFVGFFVVVFAANGAMVWVAMSTFTGVVDPRYYQTGLHYNRLIAEAERQKALGWSVDLRADVAADGHGRLVVRVRDRAGRPVEGAEVVARFVRPTSEGYDFGLTLGPRGEGTYAAAFGLPLFGQWDVRVRVRRGEDRVVVRRRLFLRPQAGGGTG